MEKRYWTSSQINEIYPSDTHYVACWEAQSFENGSTYYLIVMEKTGVKSKYGGDIYREDNKIYFKLIKGNRYIISENPIKRHGISN